MRPVAPRTGALEITIAEEQLDVMPLTVAVYGDNGTRGPRTLVSRWRLTDAERARIANGQDFYLGIVTYGNPMQPVFVQVGADGLLADPPVPTVQPDIRRCSRCGAGPLEVDDTGAPYCVDCGAA